MRVSFSKAQFQQIERGMIRQEAPAIARRLRLDFPQTFHDTSDDELLLFSNACVEQALALGDLDNVEQAYQLAAVNSQIPRIDADPVGRAYFDAIAGSDTVRGGKKIELLHRNLSHYFEGAPDSGGHSDA